MDPVRMLGAMLGQRGLRPGRGAVLGQVLNGLAAAAQPPLDPRFGPQPHLPLEALVRDSIARHHGMGGPLPPQAGAWAQRNVNVSINVGPGGIPGVPPGYPAGVPMQHPSGLAYQQRAELLIRAMIMAAQADGVIDPVERQRILQQLQPQSPAEVAFLEREFNTPHDLRAFVAAVPRGMEYEVYQISMMTMDHNSPPEAAYLRDLAGFLGIRPEVCNQIHAQVGAPPLY